MAANAAGQASALILLAIGAVGIVGYTWLLVMRFGMWIWKILRRTI